MMSTSYLQLLINMSPLMIAFVTMVALISTLGLRKKTRMQERQIQQLNQELNALLSCSRGISRKLHAYQHQFRYLNDRQDKLETAEPCSSGYKQAMALLNRGATEDEMMSACDLSRGELNLIAHLEKARAAKTQRLQ